MTIERQQLRRYEYPLLVFGIALASIHLVDFAFVHHSPGGTADVAAALAIGVVLVIVYGRLSVTWRAIVAVLCGTYVAMQGLFGHVLHVITGNAAGADYSGFLYLAGGLMILSLGVVVAVRAVR